MTDWLFDLGNTRLKCAPLFADGRVGEVTALPHAAQELGESVRDVLPARIDTAYVASVAMPTMKALLIDRLQRHTDRVVEARTSETAAGVRIAYHRPERLGVDRFLAMLAVHARETRPALVVGVGTAMTLDLLSADGRHLGGRIAPSPTLMREALHDRAGHLPVDGGRYSEFADDTDDALTSGCEGAALGLIERTLASAHRQLDAIPVVYLHGGGAQALLPRLSDVRWAASLVLDGLAVWARGTPPDANPGHRGNRDG